MCPAFFDSQLFSKHLETKYDIYLPLKLELNPPNSQFGQLWLLPIKAKAAVNIVQVSQWLNQCWEGYFGKCNRLQVTRHATNEYYSTNAVNR